jgi:hypothetical protein
MDILGLNYQSSQTSIMDEGVVAPTHTMAGTLATQFNKWRTLLPRYGVHIHLDAYAAILLAARTISGHHKVTQLLRVRKST